MNQSGNDTNQICSNSFRKHWAEAQIDSPVHEVVRYDDVAKLLITIGGFVLAMMAGTFAEVLKDRGVSNLPALKGWAGVLLFFMFVFFLSAAAVCYRQPKMIVWRIVNGKTDSDLSKEIDDWCTDLIEVIKIKRTLLYVATGTFSVVLLMMTYLLLVRY